MCENPVPCACTLEKRSAARREHIERHASLARLGFDLYAAGQITEEERDLLLYQSEREWTTPSTSRAPTILLSRSVACVGEISRIYRSVPEEWRVAGHA